MRISRRTSGGRGEYEISEQADAGYRRRRRATAPGRVSDPHVPEAEQVAPIKPHDLAGKRLILDFGKGLSIDSGTTLVIQGGKPRIRITAKGGIHLHRQLAAALLMPRPVRADDALGAGQPVLQDSQYAIEHILLSDVSLAGQSATLKVKEIVLRNQSYAAEVLRLKERIGLIDDIWGQAHHFPERIKDLLLQHQKMLKSGGPIPVAGEHLVSGLRAALKANSADLEILYTGAEDVIIGLTDARNALHLETPAELDAIEPEEVELKRRVIREWKTWAASRGAASARFRRQVREAYSDTCVICGLRLPPTDLNRNPGVDAAHILPWANYDLDHTSNGICLCKSHHWAFDEGLLQIVFDKGSYRVVVPDGVKRKLSQGGFSIDFLLKAEGAIPKERLPREQKSLPDPRFLSALSEKLPDPGE